MKVSKRRKCSRKKHQVNKSKKVILRRKRIYRRLLKKRNKNKHSVQNKCFKKNILLEYLSSTKFPQKQKVKISNKKAILKIPSIFSFTENPDETIETLQKLFNLRKGVNSIAIDHSECEIIGLGAEAIMDVILMNIKKEKYLKMKNLHLEGKLPNDQTLFELLYVSGILKHLNISKDNPSPHRIKKLDLIYGGNDISFKRNKSSESGVVSTEVTKYFIECLNTKSFDLSPEGISYFSEIVGEVINNCEKHSGSFCQWYTIGHYNLNIEGDYGECHLVIFNFGQTIYEGLKNDIKSSELKDELKNLSDQHQNRGFFSLSKKWDEELLWTLYALQDGVSRVYDKLLNPDRGTGTIKLISHFQSLGDTKDGKKSLMSIVSGNTCIYFDGKYSLENKKLENGETRQLMTFNKEKDLTVPPDSNNVRKLKNYFPGTVISMKFYLDRVFIESKMEEDRNGS
jgi:hypothetical protein